MQLESTLFAIAVIQVKPQLERVLNLPLDSLTKEIELTQDLLKLFQEYQTSADLLSFDKDLIEFEGVDGEVKVPDMIKAVRSNADKVMAMIKKEQDKQIERERTQQAYEQAKVISPPPPVLFSSVRMTSQMQMPPAPPPSAPMKKMASSPAPRAGPGSSSAPSVGVSGFASGPAVQLSKNVENKPVKAAPEPVKAPSSDIPADSGKPKDVEEPSKT